MAIIKTSNLIKKFKDLTAVDNVNLEIDEGECFGLLGPNGAGKTSLIRMLTAVSPISGGDIWIMGKDLKKYPREVKAMLGVVPQTDNLDEDLTVIQNLRTFARYFAIPKEIANQRSLDILRSLRLEEKKDAAIDELSGGMKRRLLIGRGLINDPKIVILDEPSVGLDPQARYMVWQRLRELKSHGVTQLLCTQNMEEAARLSDRVAIINQGRIIDMDTPRGLVKKYMSRQVWEIDLLAVEREKVVGELKSRGIEYEEFSGIIHVFPRDDQSTEGLPGTARAATLEDVFFKLTGRSLVE
ncbi:MAG: ABC transporter ATP-binding protein [Dehalococcoidia bacterium]|jgi:lipooligosaccharide transport system ATP-binding protein